MPAETAADRSVAPVPERFEPIALLSRARTYEVWDAWDPERSCRVVLKVVRTDRGGDPDAEPRLLAEGELLERLRHPHIVGAYETLAGPPPAIVMETLGGATLAHVIDEEEPLDSAEIAHLTLQLVSAVAYLHRRERLHLDLKPSNVIAEAGRARLIDLGLAGPPGRLAAELGTPAYLAPEQVAGERVGPEADVWGLGAVMFECVCGFPPFDDPSHEDGDRPSRHYPQLTRRARPVAEVRTVDPILGDLIAACLSPEPRERPSPAGLASGLEEVACVDLAERRLSRSLGT